MDNIAPHEIARFDALAESWWNPAGPMRALHAMNPLRIDWITRHLPAPEGLAILDVGCGAGLAAEALARLGHHVTGLDAAGAAIDAARLHAEGQHLPLAYRVGAMETLVAEGLQFDAVTALEVIEHVPDQAGFMRMLARLRKPGGVVFVSTLNRTLASLAFAKIGAEYIVRMLPAGTHSWRQFMPPAALAAHGRAAGLRLRDMAGLRYSPLSGAWRQSRDLSINYIAAFA